MGTRPGDGMGMLMGLTMGILSLFGKFRNRMLGDFVDFCGICFLGPLWEGAVGEADWGREN